MGKLWDWDHIDTDFMTSGGGSGSIVGPPIISNPRPSTGAAVGGGGGGGGDMMGDGDMGTTEDMADDDYGMRPSSAKVCVFVCVYVCVFITFDPLFCKMTGEASI